VISCDTSKLYSVEFIYLESLLEEHWGNKEEDEHKKSRQHILEDFNIDQAHFGKTLCNLVVNLIEKIHGKKKNIFQRTDVNGINGSFLIFMPGMWEIFFLIEKINERFKERLNEFEIFTLHSGIQIDKIQ
jgi:HrpA-like RNA helicase